MADRVDVRRTHGQGYGGRRPMGEQVKGMLQDKGPSASQALMVATLFPLGGLLMVLSRRGSWCPPRCSSVWP
jgi:hypothetical protein